VTTHVLHCGDCLDPVTGLASLPDKSVDHVICDPPYSERYHAREWFGASLPDGHDRYEAIGFEALDPSTVAPQIARVARRWVLAFSDPEGAFAWMTAFEAAGLRHVRIGAWVRLAGTPQFSGDRPAAGFEAITIAHATGKTRWNGGGRHARWEALVVQRDRHHVTEKPLDLMEALVRDFTDPGETVLDPFAGSGTTGVACKRLGRNFIGWERDPKYHAIAVKRIENTREQLGLWTGAA
jgi:DNA modification methylase